MYYVYEWYIVETGEVIYVGKGTRLRYKVRKHNQFFNEMIRRYNCDSRIVKEFESESDAFEYEYERVRELKAVNQCVCNIYDGGFGGSTKWWTDELRKEYSAKNVMKSVSQRERMSQKNPMKNPETAERVNSRKRRPVIINGVEYRSVKEAQEKYNTSSEVIQMWCKKGCNPQGELCRYKDSEQVIPPTGRYNKGGCRAMTYKGVKYESPIDLAREIGINNSTILGWLKRGFDPQGNPCRYDDDKRTLTYRPVNKAVIVNGVRYDSIVEARKTLKLGRGVLEYYLKKGTPNSKFDCKFADD